MITTAMLLLNKSMIMLVLPTKITKPPGSIIPETTTEQYHTIELIVNINFQLSEKGVNEKLTTK
jgi:hypothetical protein